MDIGIDSASPVTDDYGDATENAFTDTIADLSPDHGPPVRKEQR